MRGVVQHELNERDERDVLDVPGLRIAFQQSQARRGTTVDHGE